MKRKGESTSTAIYCVSVDCDEDSEPKHSSVACGCINWEREPQSQMLKPIMIFWLWLSQVTESAGGENYYIYDLLERQILWISFLDCQGYNWNRSCPAFHALNLYLFMVTTQYWHNSCDFYLCCYPSLLTFMKARNLTSWLISSYSSWHIGMLNTYQLKSMSIILTYVKGLCYSDKWIFNGLFYVGFTLVHVE